MSDNTIKDWYDRIMKESEEAAEEYWGPDGMCLEVVDQSGTTWLLKNCKITEIKHGNSE